MEFDCHFHIWWHSDINWILYVLERDQQRQHRFYVIEDQIVTYVIVELDQIDRMSVSMEWREEFCFFEMLCTPPPPADDPPLLGPGDFLLHPQTPMLPHQIPMLIFYDRSTKYSDNKSRSSIVNVCEVLCVL
jgi:hypothetical protein